MRFTERICAELDARQPALGCPLRLTPSALAEHIEACGGPSKRHAYDVVRGRYVRQPRWSVLVKWANFLSRVNPPIAPSDLFHPDDANHAPNEDVAPELVEIEESENAHPENGSRASEPSDDYDGTRAVTLRIPLLDPAYEKKITPWLCGFYICYRYSFEASLQYMVAREALLVWDEDGTLRFSLWYVRGGDKPGSNVEAFQGVVLPVGRTVMFAGVSDDRARSLLIHYDDVPEFQYCRFGFMTSARTGQDQSPVSACTVLVKLEKLPENWRDRIRSEGAVVGVDTFEKIIGGDFDAKGTRTELGNNNNKTTHAGWMERFLDNTPLEDKDIGEKDSIMRLNLMRFRLHMDAIRRNVLSEASPMVPFNKEWVMPEPAV